MEKKEAAEHMKETFHLFYGDYQKQEEEGIDLTNRPLKWTTQPDLHIYICNPTPNRGTVMLGEMGLFWRGCIEPQVDSNSGAHPSQN